MASASCCQENRWQAPALAKLIVQTAHDEPLAGGIVRREAGA